MSSSAALNPIVEPLARSAWSGPHVIGPGLILLETTGRRSGELRTRPLLSWRFGSTVVAGTVRPASDWIANLRAEPDSRVWLDGEPGRTWTRSSCRCRSGGWQRCAERPVQAN